MSSGNDRHARFGAILQNAIATRVFCSCFISVGMELRQLRPRRCRTLPPSQAVTIYDRAIVVPEMGDLFEDHMRR
jgi:hypothetical protein